MEMPEIVTAEEWQQARDELRLAEKEATRALDALAARRRRLPMVAFDTGYAFETPEGTKSLPDLFETFARDSGAGKGFQLSVFLRDGANVYRTYATTGRGIDRLAFVTSVLDLTVFGRQEDWEDSPPGWPQQPTARFPNTMPLHGEALSFGRFR
jgi:predicted dithiol-disulfide oxidoreductase (DUF899 family)